MGGGGGDGGAQQAAADQAFWQQYIQYNTKLGEQAKVTAEATRQQLTGTQLDWLRQYGQTSAMKEAGIPAPFSTVAGGFQTPMLGSAGNILPGLDLSKIGTASPALQALGR
jgi:hypothetical protein